MKATMNRDRRAPLAAGIAFAALTVPSVAAGESLHVKMFVQNAIDCAAVILVLGDDSALSTEIAGIFAGDAATTLNTLDGKETDVAREIVNGRLAVAMQDTLLNLQAGGERADLEDAQRSCIHGRFN